jgi:KUP system potassium uptake protein
VAHAISTADVDATDHPSVSQAALTLGALGVVFGDIGTSPLYAFREALNQASAAGMSGEMVIGVLSMALWSLILVVTIKYVLFLMRMDNDGEGGVLALLALAGRAVGGRRGIILVLGAAGAALFYGDAIITPSLSVLSAIEGLRTIPALSSSISDNFILYVTLGILLGLFAIQSRGTANVAKLFGPICVLWFVVIAALGIVHIADEPGVLNAFNPYHAATFVATHGMVGLFVLGAVFLTVTGAEALTADMGHFGLRPIRRSWFALVFPALILNYLGQGAFALATFERAHAAGQGFTNVDLFFTMAPAAWRGALVVLAGLATIIASQAVITGAFSLTQQAIQLGLLPRMRIEQTSAGHAGQIYLPVINWLLLTGVVVLVIGFRTSSAMAAAYGIAVTGTMDNTSCLAFVIVRKLWHWGYAKAVAAILPFLILDLVFFGANILRVVAGGWVPLAIAGTIGVVIWTWVRGRRVLADEINADAIPLREFLPLLIARPPLRVPGTAVFLTANPDVVPSALLHNLKHNKCLHERNLIVTIRTLSKPYVAPETRRYDEELGEGFTLVELRFGFMDVPDITAALALDWKRRHGIDAAPPSFVIGRNTLVASKDQGLPYWQDIVFIFLQRNATNPAEFFHIPPMRLLELGTQVTV